MGFSRGWYNVPKIYLAYGHDPWIIAPDVEPDGGSRREASPLAGAGSAGSLGGNRLLGFAGMRRITSLPGPYGTDLAATRASWPAFPASLSADRTPDAATL